MADLVLPDPVGMCSSALHGLFPNASLISLTVVTWCGKSALGSISSESFLGRVGSSSNVLPKNSSARLIAILVNFTCLNL